MINLQQFTPLTLPVLSLAVCGQIAFAKDNPGENADFCMYLVIEPFPMGADGSCAL